MMSIFIWLILVVLGIVAAMIALVFVSLPSVRTMMYISKIPGPPGVLLFGNSLQMTHLKIEDYLLWLLNHLQAYPRLMKLWILGQPCVYLKDPNDIQMLLSSNELIHKGYEYNLITDWLKEGLIHSSGGKWFSRRRMLTNSFHFRILESSLPIMNKHCRIMSETALKSKGQPIAVFNLMTDCTLGVICESAMGIDMSKPTEESREYAAIIRRTGGHLVQRLMKPWLVRDCIFNMTFEGKAFKKDINYMHDFTTKVIKERQETYFSGRDCSIDQFKTGKVKLAFLDTLLEIEARNPGTLSYSDIREEVDTFMFAGHDTTATMLNFFFCTVGTYQDVQEKVYEELIAIFGDDLDREITLQDLNKMIYLDKVIKETMRLFPVVPYISRMIDNDLNLDGVTIPKGTNVVLLAHAIHKNPKYWKDPEDFNPDRFSDNYKNGGNQDESVKRNPFSFIPFSAGPRNCIGQRYAMLEIKIAIAYVLRKMRVEAITKASDVQPAVGLVLFSANPIKCSFHVRQNVKST